MLVQANLVFLKTIKVSVFLSLTNQVLTDSSLSSHITKTCSYFHCAFSVSLNSEGLCPRPASTRTDYPSNASLVFPASVHSAKQCLWGSHVMVMPYVTKSLQLAPSKGWDYTQRNYLGYFWILPPLHQTFCCSFLNHPWACPSPSLFLNAVFGSLLQRCSPSVTAILLLSPLLPVSVSCSIDCYLTFSVVFFFALRCDSPPWTRMCTSFVLEPTLGIFT